MSASILKTQDDQRPVRSAQGTPASCVHCGSRVPRQRLHSSHTSDFCCNGCETIYQWIHSQGLEQFYTLRDDKTLSLNTNRPQGADVESDYSYLDGLRPTTSAIGHRELTFYLEGLHCIACLWLLEKLPQALDGVEALDFDPAESIATIRLNPRGRFSTVALALARLGYRPHVIHGEVSPWLGNAKKRERRINLIRLGVAGASAGNIMMFALATYAGTPPEWERFFSFTSFFLFLPVIAFSAAPLFREAIAALLGRRITVEIPLMIGIAMGSVVSFWRLIHGSDQIFFDSLSSLIFLLLSSRMVLERIQTSALRKNKLLALISPSWVRMATDRRIVDCSAIRPGDTIEVQPHELIPVDGHVLAGRSHISRASLTGEATLELAETNTWVEAGIRNQEGVLTIQVSASGYQTRLGRIIRSIESGGIKKPKLIQKIDRWSTFFVGAIALATAAAWLHGGVEQAVALLIIVCPCGLALAGPLTFAQGLGAAARRGILVSGGESLERLAEVKKIIFDKTGTLTQGRPDVVEWAWTDHISESEMSQAIQAVFRIEEQSHHPVAQALVRAALSRGAHSDIESFRSVQERKETLGKGVSAHWDGSHWKIQKFSGPHYSTEIRKDGRVIAWLKISDDLAANALSTVHTLKISGYVIGMLTGDRHEEALKIAHFLDINENEVISDASPEQKVSCIESSPRTLMIGDGANDAGALRAAFAGVSARGAAELSLRCSDAFLGEQDLTAIPTLLDISKRTVTVLKVSVAFSFLYNAIAATLVIRGWIHPWLAAIIMPLSALSVFATTQLGFVRWRRA